MTKNPKLLLAIVAVLAASAAYWMLVLSPKREELKSLDTQVSTAKDELSTAQSTLATYQKAQGAYKTNYATVVRLGKAVPADDDVRSLVVQLDDAAERSNVNFDRITVGANGASGPSTASEPAAGAETPPPGAVSVGPAGFTAMPFTFAFDGDFNNLSTFFSKLERFVTVSNEKIAVTGRLLRLESLSLKPDADRSSVTAEIGASSYLLPSSQGVTAGGSPAAPAATSTAASATPKPGGGTPPTTTATTTGATIR